MGQDTKQRAELGTRTCQGWRRGVGGVAGRTTNAARVTRCALSPRGVLLAAVPQIHASQDVHSPSTGSKTPAATHSFEAAKKQVRGALLLATRQAGPCSCRQGKASEAGTVQPGVPTGD